MRKSAPPTMTLEALRSLPLFASLDDATVSALRDLLTVRNVPVGKRLFRLGDKGDSMYFITDGRVRISVRDGAGKDVTLAELAQGDFFGEMALIDGKPRSANAAVIEPAMLAVLSRADFLAFVHEHPGVALEMLGAIADRLRRTDELLRQRASRNVNEEDAARLTLADRMADALADLAGSWKFIAALVCVLLGWVLLNSWLRQGRFDPFPYSLLSLVLGITAGLQAPIIMMSQNRQSEKDRLRADLDFKINLKNELVLAEVLRRLDVLESERLPILFEEQNARLMAGSTNSSPHKAREQDGGGSTDNP